MQQYSHWHYLLGYLIVTSAHNWPVLIALAMSARRAWLLYRAPTRPNVQWLYGWALLVLAYEYVKHLGAELVEPVYFLFTSDWAWMRPWPALAIELLAPALIVLIALRLLLLALGAPRRLRLFAGRANRSTPSGQPLPEPLPAPEPDRTIAQ
jgi:hypothetical protein